MDLQKGVLYTQPIFQGYVTQLVFDLDLVAGLSYYCACMSENFSLKAY